MVAAIVVVVGIQTETVVYEIVQTNVQQHNLIYTRARANLPEFKFKFKLIINISGEYYSTTCIDLTRH